MLQETFKFKEERQKTMTLEPSYPVVMDNDLIMGKQSMGLNEAKILRLAIMQILKEDTDFLEYTVKITDLAKLLNISSSNLYRDVGDICESLMKQVVEIGDHTIPKKKWEMFQWVSRCRYDENGMLHIKLHGNLKPYLLGLKEWYTSYPCESTLSMKSVYAIRIYEIIMSKLMVKDIPPKGLSVEIMIEDIRRACDCENKFVQIGELKKKVIDISVSEITNKTECNVTYENGKKEGRKIISIIFHVNHKLNKIRNKEDLTSTDIDYLSKKMKNMREKHSPQIETSQYVLDEE